MISRVIVDNLIQDCIIAAHFVVGLDRAGSAMRDSFDQARSLVGMPGTLGDVVISYAQLRFPPNRLQYSFNL